ncbi:hypothetical protein D3C72_2124430 [compost metagenome]
MLLVDHRFVQTVEQKLADLVARRDAVAAERFRQKFAGSRRYALPDRRELRVDQGVQGLGVVLVTGNDRHGA